MGTKTVAERIVTRIAPRRGRFDGNISDLFFNTDLENCRVIARGAFEGWDETALKHVAKEFLACLDRLNVQDLPTVDELVADFYARI